MKTFFSDLLKWFVIINTAIMLVVWISIFRLDTIWVEIIPQIFCASLATSLVTTAVFSINPKKPMGVPVRICLFVGHFLVLCAIIMGLGAFFNWFDISLTGAVTVAGSVAAVYFITAVISYLLSKNEAEEMTNALKNFKED